MKFGIKKTSALVMSAAMALTAFGGGMSQAFAAKKDATIDTSKFVTISHLSLGDPAASGQVDVVMKEWNKYLKEKVNAALEIQWVGWTDYMTKYNLMLASGEELDLINSATDWLDMWPNAQKGAFLELNDLLPVYAPMTWESIPEEHWEEVKYDGDIIAIPEDQYSQWINHGFMFRGDWAEEAGVKLPVESWEEFGDYLGAVKELKGDEGVIPWDSDSSAHLRLFGGWVSSKTNFVNVDPLPNAGGSPWFAAKSNDEWWVVETPLFYVDEDGNDLFLEFAKLMKEWGDAGYWREDALNNQNDIAVQVKAGLSAARQHHTQTYVGFYKELEIDQPGADLQWFPFGLETKNLSKMSFTHGATAIGVNSKNPERALMVYDLIRNDETMYKLFNWGIEGTQYVITEDGKRDRPEDWTNETHGFSSNFWGGRMDLFELEYPSATQVDNWKEIYDEYETYANDYLYGKLVFDRTPVESEIAALSDVANRLIPGIAAGFAGDPEKAVEKFREEFKKAGFEKVQKEVEKQMAAFKEMMDAE